MRGATSFARIRTVRDVVNPTFREACEMLGLVETDKSLDDALTEATSFQMPCALRKMFAFIIIFCEYTNIRGLWDKHFESMAEDYRRTHGSSKSVVQLVLRDISDIVRSLGKDIKYCRLPDLDESGDLFAIAFLHKTQKYIAHSLMIVCYPFNKKTDDPSRDYYRELTEEKKSWFQ